MSDDNTQQQQQQQLQLEKFSLPKFEEEILEFWKRNKTFEKSISNLEGHDEFVFYDGPPFASGLPHYGHLLTGYIKDMIARYQTQIGKKVDRRFGWDCHGLPAEMGVEKEIKVSGRMEIVNYGIDKFNDACRKSVMRYVHEWESYVTRQARWVDFVRDYKTMDTNYMESVIWAFKELYNKGLMYRAMRVMPYSWACETAISNFETKLDDAYRERADKAATVAFKFTKESQDAIKKKLDKNHIDHTADTYDVYILAWTTTPWTLPSNLAVAVGADIEYLVVRTNGKLCIIAGSSAEQYKKELAEPNQELDIVGKIAGAELAGLKYEPLFPYFAEHKNSFVVLAGDFVEEGGVGTGAVHIAPGFGEEDQKLCDANGIELVCPIDNGAKFTDEVWNFKGQHVFDTNDEIIKVLKQNGNWIKTEQYLHSYPHCWRTDTPIIYRAIPSWYVAVTKFKDRMCELNKEINWIPGHIKDGIFGKWLENARDWSISRNRFWGTPIPVWESDDPAYPRIDVYGSIQELEQDFGVKVHDLHRPYIDALVRPNPNDPTGKSMMRRTEDVFDCWFESGSMPYAQSHYPFENKEWFESHFPADFIVEYVAQTRGWFYTLMVLSTALFDRPPFLNCICHGVILDEKGRKLSKRLQNYADPHDIFNKFGSDALRFVMLSSPIMYGEELLIDKDGKMVTDALKAVFQPIYNAYNFFSMYIKADKIDAKNSWNSNNVLDQYILSKLAVLVGVAKNAMDKFDSVTVCKEIEKFIDLLNNWYIRRARARFWSAGYSEDKQHAYDTLFVIFSGLFQVFAPIAPLFCEYLYRSLYKIHDQDNDFSVHLSGWPDFGGFAIDHELVKSMDLVREICSQSLSIRNNNNIRVRQPIAKIIIAGEWGDVERFKSLIEDEINAKEVVFESDILEHAKWQPKLNYPVLGKNRPAQVKEIAAALAAGKWTRDDAGHVVVNGITLGDDECVASLIPLEQDVKVCGGNKLLIKLDLNITQELRMEGIARDVVRFVQQMRKDKNFMIKDQIRLRIEADKVIIDSVVAHKEYIASQVLAQDIECNITNTEAADDTVLIEDKNVRFTIEKVLDK